MDSDVVYMGIISAAIIIMIFVVGFVMVILFARKQKIAQELKESQLHARLAETRFSALRSQMNPHFIFNCLNSIKLYTEQNNNEAASEYLSKFARLIRLILDGARRDKIVLSEEIETLDLYLQLECMRFKERLAYEIITDKNVDTDFVELPPMLLQPFVENAIWHGLMNKPGGGKITIRFTQPEQENFLVTTVGDNGIGRAKAQELKTMKDNGRKSHGQTITEERIQLMNQHRFGGASIATDDLYDENGEASGTRVTIKIPIK